MNKIEVKKMLRFEHLLRFRLLFSMLAVSVLAACSQPARVSQMAVPNMLAPVVAANPELLGAMAVGDVSGGKATNPLWTSQVDNPQFKEALERSLEFNGLLASPGTSPRLVVSATLVELNQPFIGLDFTVTPKVVYRVVQSNGEAELLREELVTPYTADFSSSFIAVERLRLANEGAIRESIKRFLVRFGEVWSSRTGRPAAPIVPPSPATAPTQPSS